jgi:hypothetical protein
LASGIVFLRGTIMSVRNLFPFLLTSLLIVSCHTLDFRTQSLMVEDLALPGSGEAQTYTTLPTNPDDFWSQVMTREVAVDFQAVGGVTQCNRYVAYVLEEAFPEEVYTRVFPQGLRGANQTFLDWAENPHLHRLHPEEFSINEIQNLANKGYLILMAYYFPGVAGHVAFVGSRDLQMFTIPPLKDFEGKTGLDLPGPYLPVMVQAGTYTGITTMVYATNGWLRDQNFEKGTVRYYLVSQE